VSTPSHRTRASFLTVYRVKKYGLTMMGTHAVHVTLVPY
jgi:hypothetical protein